ncbi:MAG: hypothetical protein AAFW89_02795 [Bacteroidota bacterium]
MVRSTISASRILLVLFLISGVACDNPSEPDQSIESTVNLSHLDYLGETMERGGEQFRMIHIYADAPSYAWVGDDDEGQACVDDVARAAVVYLRHFELTGNTESAEKAKELLRFVRYMQTDEGLFYNFVWDNTLRKNTEHENSVADKVNWWAARAVWALGVGARTLAEYDSSFTQLCLTSIEEIYPKIDAMTSSYPNTKRINGYEMPTWLISETGSDASSELLLGLNATHQLTGDMKYKTLINKLGEGIARMQYGNSTEASYGAFISSEGGWHGWGNSQTMALAEAGLIDAAKKEADNFYTRMLVEGWLHSFPLDNPENTREFEQIAYATRGVAVGLIRLYEATKNEDYAILAGLAASWFTGNNVANARMYIPLHGYGYDGIDGPEDVNNNSGAESTIEALFTILEVENHLLSNKWLYASSDGPYSLTLGENLYRYRMYSVTHNGASESIVLISKRSESGYALFTETEFQEFKNQN